jgi:hypothetical protein|tara:strand:- start:851 stop:1069 length:219 start_codon:yes stop_codon:yes gene_type:complete
MIEKEFLFMEKELMIIDNDEFVTTFKTIVDEFDFPEYIVVTKGSSPVEKVFTHYPDAEKYHNEVLMTMCYSM